jgi:hypothetical protein
MPFNRVTKLRGKFTGLSFSLFDEDFYLKLGISETTEQEFLFPTMIRKLSRGL